jgi:hypothetical protein
MVFLADSPNVTGLTRTVVGKWLDVMKLDVSFVLNWVVIDKAIKHSISALLCQDLLLLGICNLPFKGSHSSLSGPKNRLTPSGSPKARVQATAKGS